MRNVVVRNWHLYYIHFTGSPWTLLTSLENKRLVGLTSNIAKGAGRIWCRKIMSFLITAEYLSPQQHGFIKGRSCQSNILTCKEAWTKAIDDGFGVDVANFDYASAFDKV